jgi:hypothetical protein
VRYLANFKLAGSILGHILAVERPPIIAPIQRIIHDDVKRRALGWRTSSQSLTPSNRQFSELFKFRVAPWDLLGLQALNHSFFTHKSAQLRSYNPRNRRILTICLTIVSTTHRLRIIMPYDFYQIACSVAARGPSVSTRWWHHNVYVAAMLELDVDLLDRFVLQCKKGYCNTKERGMVQPNPRPFNVSMDLTDKMSDNALGLYYECFHRQDPTLCICKL